MAVLLPDMSLPPHLPVLHALRAIAALMVMVTHFEVAVHLPEINSLSIDTNTFTYKFFSRAGNFGVDLFFYLSGFLMVYVTQSSTSKDALGFLLKRIFRIIPVYWVCLSFYLFLLYPKIYYPDLFHFIFLLPRINQDPPGFGFTILAPAWTLTYEMLFYLIFALGLRCSAACIKPELLVPLLLTALVVGLQWWFAGQPRFDPNTAAVAAGEGTAWAILSMIANPLMLQFGVGVVAGAGYIRLRQSKHRPPVWLFQVAVVLSIAAAVVAYYFLPTSHGWNGMATPAMLVFLAGLFSEQGCASLHLGFVRKLGDWSFGIYLVHVPILDAMQKFFPNFWTTYVGLDGLLVLCVMVFTTAFLLFKYVEVPFIRIGKLLAQKISA